MARFTGGWVKLHRKILDNNTFDDPITFALFGRLLLWAHRSERNGIKPGQVVCSAYELAETLGVHRAACRRRLERLESERVISLQSGPRGTVVTILNWSEYQDTDPVSGLLTGLQNGLVSAYSRPTDRPINGEIQEERIIISGDVPPPAPKPKAKKAKAPTTEGGQVWDAYLAAYTERYKVAPVRNATVNGQCSQLVKRLGLQDAVAVVRYYLRIDDNPYFKRESHSLGPCLKSCEALRTQMIVGTACKKVIPMVRTEADLERL